MNIPSKYIIPLVLSLATHGADDDAWLTPDRYDELHVVVKDTAPASKHFGVDRFREYWEKVTGFPVSQSESPEDGRVNVWLGDDAEGFFSETALAGLGDDGFVIRTSSGRPERAPRSLPGDFLATTRHLAIAGGPKRGVMYGVVQFIEDYLGVRWLTPDVTHIPKAPESIPALDVRFVPAFSYRDVSYRSFVHHADFAVFHRLNGFWSNVPPELGDHISYARGWPGLGHTFYLFVPPDEYFDEHPEYFSEVDGERLRRKTQLCLTNPDVLRIVIEKTRALLREVKPNERIVSISQMDWANYCQCAACRAVDEEEESHAGTLVRFVNAVADAIAEEFPRAYIDTFAYFYSQKPPKLARPRDNVIIRLTSIQCDFSKPLSDAESRLNRRFQEDIAGWAAITKNLYVWDYTQNWYSFQGPHPNLHVLQPNAKFYKDHGVTGLFEQASPHSPHSDFEHLKAYVLSHVLWDPEAEGQKLYDEFIALYYREAAPFIHEYLDLITARVQQNDIEMRMFNPIYWMDYGLVEQSQAIFRRAFDTLEDPVVAERLRYAYLPVQYAALVCPPDVTLEEDRFVLRRPPSQTFDEYWAMLQDYGVTHLADWPIEEFRRRLDGATPPRYEEVSILKLRDERRELWITPSKGGAVVRWKDERYGVELLRGWQGVFKPDDKVAAWIYSDEESPYGPEFLARPFEVTARTGASATVETLLDNGLRVKRDVLLEKNMVRFGFSQLNSTTNTLQARLRERFDFSTGNFRELELWTRDSGAWTRKPLRQEPGALVFEGVFDAGEAGRWAFAAPSGGWTLIGEASGSVHRIRYVFDDYHARLTIELEPRSGPLTPNEERRIEARFTFTEDIPHNQNLPDQ